MKYKQLLLSPLSLIPVGLQPAVAADMPVKVKAPQATAFTPSWAGFYAGLNLGVISDQSRITGFVPSGLGAVTNYCFADGLVGNPCTPTNSQTAVGVLGGLQLGYNFQAGKIVYGLEGDIGLSSSRKSTTGANAAGGTGNWTVKSGIEALSTLRGRLGYVFDNNTLLYATGGLAVAKTAHSFQASNSAFGSGPYSWADAGWRAGFTVGGGLEYQVSRNWSVKGEALYYDLGKKDLVSTASRGGFSYAWGATDRINGVVARVGLNYLFH